MGKGQNLQCRREGSDPGRSLLVARILDVLVIFADRFSDLFAWSQRPDHVKLPRLGECTWIFDGDINIQVGEIGPTIALDHVQHFGVR
jgi:hypothetical protein